MTEPPPPFALTISLNVLEHPGINLTATSRQFCPRSSRTNGMPTPMRSMRMGPDK